jgi:formate dehydrogenase iron-sulfur subunit
MDKCTFCAGGPEPDGSPEEFAKYGRNRLSEGKLPACAEMCSTKALIAGDADVLSNIYRDRVTIRAARGTLSGPPWGWDAAYGAGDKAAAQQSPAQQPQPAAPAPKS